MGNHQLLTYSSYSDYEWIQTDEHATTLSRLKRPLTRFEVRIDFFAVQLHPVEELHGVRNGHFVLVKGEAKGFLRPVGSLGDLGSDERSCLKEKHRITIANRKHISRGTGTS